MSSASTTSRQMPASGRTYAPALFTTTWAMKIRNHSKWARFFVDPIGTAIEHEYSPTQVKCDDLENCAEALLYLRVSYSLRGERKRRRPRAGG